MVDKIFAYNGTLAGFQMKQLELPTGHLYSLGLMQLENTYIHTMYILQRNKTP